MLYPISPLPLICTQIPELERTIPFPLIILPLSLVSHLAILRETASTLELTAREFTLIAIPVFEQIDARSGHLPVVPATTVDVTTVTEVLLTGTML